MTRDGKIKNKLGEVQSRFATIERLDENIRPIYQGHGFAVSTSIDGVLSNGKYDCRAEVRHSGGHVGQYKMPLALDSSGSKNETQGMGSTLSYARRYLLIHIFNIITEGQDTDGNRPDAKITQQQADNIRTRLDAAGKDKSKFVKALGVESIEEITISKHDYALGMLTGGGVR